MKLNKDKNNWKLKLINNNEFQAPNIIIAGGVGSFEPRKLSLKKQKNLKVKMLFYSVKNKEQFKNKIFYFWWRRLCLRLGTRIFKIFKN